MGKEVGNGRGGRREKGPKEEESVGYVLLSCSPDRPPSAGDKDPETPVNPCQEKSFLPHPLTHSLLHIPNFLFLSHSIPGLHSLPSFAAVCISSAENFVQPLPAAQCL